MAFASREEYERWKQARAAGQAPPLPPQAGVPATVGPASAAPARKGLLASFEGVPAWGWVFCVACGAIPVVTLGGALPAGLGVGGASLCASIARDQARSVALRVTLCAVVTVAAWAILGGLLVALHGRG